MDKRFPHIICVDSVRHVFEIFHVTLLLLGIPESFEKFPLVLKQTLPDPGLLIVTPHDLRSDCPPSDLADVSLLPEVSMLSNLASNIFLFELVPEWLP